MNDREAHGAPPLVDARQKSRQSRPEVGKGHRTSSEQHGSIALDGALPRKCQVEPMFRWPKPAAGTNRAARLLPTRNNVDFDSGSGSLASSLAAQHSESD